MAITTRKAVALERAGRTLGIYLLSRPTRAAAHEVKHLHQLERAGESEWTPWIAIPGLILFVAAIGLLMYGMVEAASHLLASASSALDLTSQDELIEAGRTLESGRFWMASRGVTD